MKFLRELMESKPEETIYQRNGYKNRNDYLRSVAEDYGVDLNTIAAVAEMLGPNEDFDGLLSTLEDMEDMEDMDGGW